MGRHGDVPWWVTAERQGEAMDPNETLKRMRECCDNPSFANMEELVGLVEGLDDWLTKGGFLPSEWQSHAGIHRGP